MRMPNRTRRFFLGMALALAMVCCAPLAHAGSITYYYTGQAFTSFSGGFSCPSGTCGLSGSMTLASPLGANAFSDPTTPISFSFTDGVTTFDNTNSTLINSLFATDGSGQITAWVFSGAMDNNQFTWYQSANWPQSSNGDTLQVLGGGDASNSLAGSWSVTPPVVTPEPASWTLLATGALGLLGLAVRRRGAARG